MAFGYMHRHAWLNMIFRKNRLLSQLFMELMSNMRNTRLAARKLDSPAIYEISILGEMYDNWRDYLDATSVLSFVDAKQIKTTTLTCELLDQSQLLGILNMLHAWGSVLIRLECIDVITNPAN